MLLKELKGISGGRKCKSLEALRNKPLSLKVQNGQIIGYILAFIQNGSVSQSSISMFCHFNSDLGPQL